MQYAAALAWLVRAAGYPARVAFGFTRGAGPASTASYTLTNLQPARLDRGLLPRLRLGAVRRHPVAARSPGRPRTAWAPDLTKPQPEHRRRRSPVGPRRPAPDQRRRPAEHGVGRGRPPRRRPVCWPGRGCSAASAVLILALALSLAPALRRRALRQRRRARAATLAVPIGAVVAASQPLRTGGGGARRPIRRRCRSPGATPTPPGRS